MIDRGATTMWERWDGVDRHGRPTDSLNHYSKGAVITFLHRYTAGIQPVDDGPAYRRFRIAPSPGGGLKWAAASLETPYGRIESAWHLDDNDLMLRVRVPAGTSAEIILTDGRTEIVGPGEHMHASPLRRRDRSGAMSR